MITTTEYINSVKSQRSQMINVYTQPYIDAKAEAILNLEEKRDYIQDTLFKTGTYEGYNVLCINYWNSIINLFTTGSIGSNLSASLISTWEFENDVYNANGSLKTSPISAYISDNDVTVGSDTIYKDLLDFVGISPTETGSFDSGYVYTSQALALADQTTYASSLARTGSGLLGARLIDVDNQSTAQDPAPPNYWKYIVGDGVPDDEDNFDSDLLTKLNTLISNLNTVKTYNDNISAFYTNLLSNDYIINKTVFTGFDSGFTTFKSAIETQISELTTYYNNFTTYSGDLVTYRAQINTDLEALIIDLASYIVIAGNRKTTVLSTGGINTIFGDPETSGTVNSMREIQLASLVAFPDGTIEQLNNLNSSSTAVDLLITKEERKLDVYGISDTEWIPTPEVKSVFKNSTGVFIKWVSEFHANKYHIYRRLSSEITDNSDWSITYLIDTLNQTDDLDPSLSVTYQQYIDTSSLISGQSYTYRVVAEDDLYSLTTVASDSSSKQSDVWDGAIIDECSITI